MPIKFPRPLPPKNQAADSDPPPAKEEHSLSVRARLARLDAIRARARKARDEHRLDS